MADNWGKHMTMMKYEGIRKQGCFLITREQGNYVETMQILDGGYV